MAATVAIAVFAVIVLVVQRRDFARVLEGHESERSQWHRERSELLNRIKPETAQYIPGETPAPSPPPVPFDDDDGYWADRETREELADRLMAEEVSNGSDR